ncbi:MAG: alpha/beta fold hydrolase [Pseudomonadales bacterium]
MTVSESVLSVGSPTPLNGIVTAPVAGADTGTVLVILNSGLLHHVGSCLLSVRLARNAAANGIRAIRFDTSGIGDSAVRPASADHEQQSVDETCEVLEYAQQHWGAERFVLAGLCSGAFAAFGAALRNPKVAGIVAIAPFGYRTRKWYLRHYQSKFLSARRWQRLARKLMGKQQGDPESYESEFLEASASVGWSVPPHAQLQSGYQQLLSRDVQFLHTFTGGEASYYNYEGQMRDMFPELDFGSALTEAHLPQARHIITEPVFQDHVLAQTQSWLNALHQR